VDILFAMQLGGMKLASDHSAPVLCSKFVERGLTNYAKWYCGLYVCVATITMFKIGPFVSFLHF
jgi:hypothetical protein